MHVVLLLHQLFSDKKNHLSPRFPKGRFESIHILPLEIWKFVEKASTFKISRFHFFLYVCPMDVFFIQIH